MTKAGRRTSIQPGKATRRAGLMVILAACLLILPLRATAPDAQTRAVDVAIVLAVDCSWSVDELEYAQQMQGLAAAIRSKDVVDAIRNGPRGRIAVALLQWSARNDQHLALDWQIIETPEDALLVSAKIHSAPRVITEGATSITAAITLGTLLHARRPFAADRQVIDVSGDGLNNNGGSPHRARDRAIASGITINGLAILNDVEFLHYYFRNHIIGGNDPFVETADDYSDYHRAIKRKLLREIDIDPAVS